MTQSLNELPSPCYITLFNCVYYKRLSCKHLISFLGRVVTTRSKHERGETRVYRICTCPSCNKRFVTKLHITNKENITSKISTETVKTILESITLQTTSCDGELEEGIRGALKPLIQDEALYEKVMQRIRAVYEARI